MTTQEVFTIADQYDRQLLKLEDKAVDRLNRALESAYNALEKDLIKSYDNISGNASLLQVQRRALILQELGGLLEIVKPDADINYESTFGSMLAESTNSGFEIAGLLTQAMGNEKLQPFKNIAIEAVASSAKNSYERLKRHGDTFADTATNIISMGIAQGWGVRRIIQPIQQQLGITKERALMIVRTESIAAYTDASEQRYRDADIESFLWIAIGDTRTCSYCLARNLQVFKLGDTRPPIHPSDRCTVAPWEDKWKERGLIDLNYLADKRQQALSEAQVSPNYGLAPFEKAAGMKEAPKPIYTPIGIDRVLPSSIVGAPNRVISSPPPTKVRKPKVAPINYEIDTSDHKALINLGGEFYQRNYKDINDIKVKKLQDELVELGAKIQLELDKKGVASDRLTKEFAEKENTLFKAFDRSLTSERKAMGKLREAIIAQNGNSFAASMRAENLEYSPFLLDNDISRYKATFAEFFTLTGGKGSNSLQNVYYSDDRAYATKGGDINVGDGSKASLFHEAGHHVEFESKKLNQAFNAWMQSRAESNKPEMLSKLTGISGFDDSEVAIKDKFIDPYVGKIYSDRSTEVLSMGLEHFTNVTDMIKLRSRDPEHFNLTLGAILAK
jgi:SPP1 gp7 family putative phage head morphogenesis protein